MSDTLAVVLRSLVPDDVRTGWRRIDAADHALLTDAERDVVGSAVERRRSEFATGRALLRSLLARDVELLRGSSGAPIVPADVVVSLAHDRVYAVAVVAASARYIALGIDLEPIAPLHDVAEVVVRPDDVTPDVVTAFVAKEACYKAWSTLGGDMLAHHDVRIRVAGETFEGDLRGELTVTGRLGRTASHVLAAVVIRPRSA